MATPLGNPARLSPALGIRGSRLGAFLPIRACLSRRRSRPATGNELVSALAHARWRSRCALDRAGSFSPARDRRHRHGNTTTTRCAGAQVSRGESGPGSRERRARSRNCRSSSRARAGLPLEHNCHHGRRQWRAFLDHILGGRGAAAADTARPGVRGRPSKSWPSAFHCENPRPDRGSIRWFQIDQSLFRTARLWPGRRNRLRLPTQRNRKPGAQRG